jgi:hypothetical protein
MRLTMQQRQAVVAKVAGRYQRSRKKEKSVIMSGADIHTVAQLLGHKDLRMGL